ncbi:MAG: hypothetical protein WC560_10570 [Syntrophales bacterium]
MKTWMQKIYDSRLYPAVIGVLYLILCGIVIYTIAYYPKGKIEVILMKWVPWSLRINFLLLLIGILSTWGDISGIFKKLFVREELTSRLNKKGFLLISLLVFALIFVSIVTTRTHRLYYDEDIYANIGQNIANTGQTGMCNYGTFEYGEYYAHWLSYNKDPSGWPTLISFVFQLLGTNEIYAFFLNNLIFILSVLVVFSIVFTLTNSYFPSFLAALVFTLIPHNLIWHNTVAAEPSGALFAGLTVLFLSVYLRTGKKRHLFLLSVVIPLACQMRPESVLIVAWVIVAAIACPPSPGSSLYEEKGEMSMVPVKGENDTATNRIERDSSGRIIFLKKELWVMGLLTALFLLPHILHLYVIGGHSWGADGKMFSMAFFWKNLSTNGFYYLNNRHFPFLFTALAIIGLLFVQHALRWRLLIFTWFLLFWGIFLFFYAGSYQYGADVRFAILSFMPLSILAGLGGDMIRDRIGKIGCRIQKVGDLIIVVLIFAWMQFLPLIHQEGQEAWGARYDHYYAREFIKKIPRRSIILTHIPTMFLLWQQNAIQTYAGINNPDIISHLMEKYQGNVYFHYNYWCNTSSDVNRKMCQGIKDNYTLEEIASASEQSHHYGLYKMALKQEKKMSHPK